MFRFHNIWISLQLLYLLRNTSRLLTPRTFALYRCQARVLIYCSSPQIQLVVLEPSLTALSSLPILRAENKGGTDGRLSTPNRLRQIRIADGIKWLLGNDAIGYVDELGEP